MVDWLREELIRNKAELREQAPIDSQTSDEIGIYIDFVRYIFRENELNRSGSNMSELYKQMSIERRESNNSNALFFIERENQPNPNELVQQKKDNLMISGILLH